MSTPGFADGIAWIASMDSAYSGYMQQVTQSDWLIDDGKTID